MITIITGKPGAGKTLFMTYRALEMFLKGYDVYANWKLDFSSYIKKKKIKSLKPRLFNEALFDIDDTFTSIKTRTMDNGIENRYWQELGVDTYFCDPYSSWQKGGVENVNAMIRRFIPKGCNISKYNIKYIKMEIMVENGLLIDY